jgi:hypothetical protein
VQEKRREVLRAELIRTVQENQKAGRNKKNQMVNTILWQDTPARVAGFSHVLR